MIRKLAVVSMLCLLSAISAAGQGARRDGLALSTFGPYIRPIPGASVRVCQSGSSGTGACTPLQVIYSDFGLTVPITGSVVTPNSAGTYTYYVAPGTLVDEVISGVGVAVTKNTNIAVGTASTGTVTTFSAGNLSPLFTTSVLNASTTPALSFALSTQTANRIFAGPTTGSAAAPTFRALVAADFPAPFVPNDDNMTDLGGGGDQWRSVYAGTSVISPVFQSKAANAADTGVLRVGNNEAAVCSEIFTPGTDGCITLNAADAWNFTNRLLAPNGTDALNGYGFTNSVNSGLVWSGTQLVAYRLGTTVWASNGDGMTSANTLCTGTSTRCLSATTQPTGLEPGMEFSGGTVVIGLPKVVGDNAISGWGASQKGHSYFNTTSNVPRFFDGTILRDFGIQAYNCGTTTTCANTYNTGARVVFGSVALSSGTPSTATVASISPAFTSTATYRCSGTNQTTATNNLLKIVNTSSSSFTITGPDTVTDVIGYVCAGY